MSIIIASGEQISKSPLNTSTSKQMFSFPKADRFRSMNRSSSCSTFYYDLPSTKMMRSTSFGKGDKYDFTNGAKTKNSQFYNIPSDFDPKKPHSPSFSFGISRSYYDKVYYETNKYFDKDVPGPGKYNYSKPFGSDTYKFSIFGKGETKQKSANSPGPGQYPIVSINPQGKYPISSMKNATAIIFGVNKEKRFNYKYDKNPGPDRYDQKSLITGTGFNYVSKYKSPTAKSITGKSKDFSSVNKNPGPGSYRAFSEFGIYESKNAHKHNLSRSVDKK